MKKIFAIFSTLIISVSLLLSSSAVSSTYTWFCVHRLDHLQPQIDNSINFIDKYDAFYLDNNHNDENMDKVVYLTFDAGYNNGNIDKILDILKKENVPAAFFILGHLIINDTELVIRMFNEGHLVCNHTFSHDRITQKNEDEFRDELKKLEDTCTKLTGKTLSLFFRPPEGVFNESSLMYAKQMGYKTVFWSFAYEDWNNQKQMPCEKAKKKILDNLHNGEIMLLHPTSSTNAEILDDVIQEIKKQGYRFGTLDEIKI